ncbi:hypothetical protein EPO17_01485 [Patescibacteria group bacterium]|nr:MAG: hypothetical protein EPO17_01485 [Patescibacteria group bacterium]
MNAQKHYLSIIGVFCFLFLILYGFYYYKDIQNNLFRLSKEQVQESLFQVKSGCESLEGCNLIAGDILIRRYVTERVDLVNRLFHPYFTHTALYLGDGYIVEAIGNERSKADEIKVSKLKETDWLDGGVEKLVIIRPRKYGNKLNTVVDGLKDVANNSEYTFGFSENNDKKVSCADLIFRQLENNGMIEISDKPKIITPDYLFAVLTRNNQDFEIVGY